MIGRMTRMNIIVKISIILYLSLHTFEIMVCRCCPTSFSVLSSTLPSLSSSALYAASFKAMVCTFKAMVCRCCSTIFSVVSSAPPSLSSSALCAAAFEAMVRTFEVMVCRCCSTVSCHLVTSIFATYIASSNASSISRSSS